MQRGERVAAVKISSVRRKAAQKFWAPQQSHRPLQHETWEDTMRRAVAFTGRRDRAQAHRCGPGDGVAERYKKVQKRNEGEIMEYKDEMHMKADTENIPETQEAPQKQAATESEQETKERVPIGRRSDKAR